ncbi:unnamed protein product, partial [Polarella glacialis]
AQRVQKEEKSRWLQMAQKERNAKEEERRLREEAERQADRLQVKNEVLAASRGPDAEALEKALRANRELEEEIVLMQRQLKNKSREQERAQERVKSCQEKAADAAKQEEKDREARHIGYVREANSAMLAGGRKVASASAAQSCFDLGKEVRSMSLR